MSLWIFRTLHVSTSDDRSSLAFVTTPLGALVTALCAAVAAVALAIVDLVTFRRGRRQRLAAVLRRFYRWLNQDRRHD